MTDYTKTCWYCGVKSVIKVSTWFKCTGCGATYVPPVETHGPELEPGNVTLTTRSGLVKLRARHPTRSVTRRSARARAVSGK